MTTYTDSVHGNIAFSPLIEAIIQTKLFQRLKEVKQLGCVSMYFPDVNHTRYEHCIGTFFLADKMLKSLETNSDIIIDDFYKKCVCIAGLLHDIGHGPFSHYWEKLSEEFGCNYNHEENSKNAVDKIFDTIDEKLDETCERHNFGIELIKAFITGDKTKLSRQIERKYEFLFEIIHNKKCDIDVDKWDYLLRDYHYAEKYLQGMTLKINFDQIFTNARVSSDNSHIEYNRQNFNQIYYLFDARSKLHIHIYQEPNVKIREKLLKEAINVYVNEGHKYNGLHLFEITSINEEFLSLTDDKLLRTLKNIHNSKINDCLHYLEKNFKEISINQNMAFAVKIEKAGEKMKEESIPFYGKFPDDKIIPTRGFYKKIHYFKSTI